MRGLVIAVTILAPATALAHAALTDPPPREASDGIKTGPCGTAARGTAFTQLQPGQQVTVKWRESIDHTGCFDVMFSAGNDQNWMRLARIPDEGGTPNRNYQTSVTLPTTPCESCTLALRQIMRSSGTNPVNQVCDTTTPDAMDGGPPTYFSCANVRVGTFSDAAPSTGGGGSSGTSSGATASGSSSGGGATTTPTDGGYVSDDEPASPNYQAGKGQDCSVGGSAAPGASAFGAGLAALVLGLRARRSRRTARPR
jgi:hypothetical protein